MIDIALFVVALGLAAAGFVWLARSGRSLLDRRLGGMEDKLG